MKTKLWARSQSRRDVVKLPLSFNCISKMLRHRPLQAVITLWAVCLAFYAGAPALPVVKAATGVTKGMPLPPGIAADAQSERYSPDTLFEVINGDADIYLKAGFVELETRRYHLKANAGPAIDVRAYQMDRHQSAFAVFSIRRGREAIAETLAPFAYRYQNGLFFVHGPYYVELLADGANTPPIEAMRRLAAVFIDTHEVVSEPIPELSLFPPQNLIPGSEVLHPAGVFGFEPLSGLFTARYRVDDTDVTAFLRPCHSPEAAARLGDDFIAFLIEYDGVVAHADHPLPNSRLIRVLDAFTLVFTHGKTVAGVQEAKTPEMAQKLARRLKAGLSVEE